MKASVQQPNQIVITLSVDMGPVCKQIHMGKGANIRQLSANTPQL